MTGKNMAVLMLVAMLFSAGCAGQKSGPAPVLPAETADDTSKGNALYNKGCYKRALDYFFRAHETAVSAGNDAGRALALNNMGNVYQATGDWEGALPFFREAFYLYSRINDTRGALTALTNQAACLVEENRPEKAGGILDTAEALARQSIPSGFGPLSRIRGVWLLMAGKPDQALAMLERAEASEGVKKGAVFFAKGRALEALKRPEQAAAAYETALAADRAGDFFPQTLKDLEALGRVYARMNRHKEASEALGRAAMGHALSGGREKALALMPEFEKQAKLAGRPVTVTRHFVDMWNKGEIRKGICP